MSKNKFFKVVNLVLPVLLISQAVTGMLGTKLSPEVFEWTHRQAAWVLLAAAAVHLVLNWNWVKANYLKFLKK